MVTWSRSGDGPEEAASKRSVDVANADEVNKAFDADADLLASLDAVIVNAGITRDGLAMRMSDEAWRDVLSTNLDGAFHVIRAALPTLLKRRQGSIVIVSSIAPFVGLPGQANYAASKAALVGLGRSLASEVGRRGVTVNIVAPGLIDTDMTRNMGDSLEAITPRIPLGRIGTPDDVAGLVEFLCSPAARYITGAVIPVDGGLSMGL